MGHLKYLSEEIPEARDCYERTLSFVADPSETHSIYLRLASIYLQEGNFENAKSTFLQACRNSPSCVSWLGVGIACYRVSFSTLSQLPLIIYLLIIYLSPVLHPSQLPLPLVLFFHPSPLKILSPFALPLPSCPCPLCLIHISMPLKVPFSPFPLSLTFTLPFLVSMSLPCTLVPPLYPCPSPVPLSLPPPSVPL